MTEAQSCLYYIAENMRMDRSISDEGYEFFQQAIKALEQVDVLDTIRSEIMQLDYDIESVDYDYDDMSCTEEVHMICREEVLQIIDEHKTESEEKS